MRLSAAGWRPIPAVSLSLEPANITALANDVGTEVIFLRQLIAQARPEDVAVGISTSGGSRNIIMALEEARKRGLLTVALLGCDGGEILRRGSGRSRAGGALRLHSPHPGSPGVHLSHHSRTAGDAPRCPRLNSSAAPRCPYTQEMREWLEWQDRDFVEYDVELDAEAFDRMREATGGQTTVPVLVEDGRVVQIGWQGRGCIAGKGISR